MNRMARGKELQLRDVVQSTDGPYMCGTVIQIDEGKGEITVARPYITTSDFSVADNRVLRFIGLEEYKLYNDTPTILLDRPNDRKSLL